MGAKVFIQIPCYNEAETLPKVLAALPREMPGVSEVRVVVIDDGSTDGTADVALAHGADLVLRHRRNRGYLAGFMTGMRASLAHGADIIVNTDGDDQYPGHHVADLVRPLLEDRADLVIGDRLPAQSPHFSYLKRRFQVLGSWAVSRLAGFEIPDAASGFRAFSRRAAKSLQPYTSFSHSLETLVRFGKLGIDVLFVPITTHATPRPSRLVSNMWMYMWRQAKVLVRVYSLYEPLKTFLIFGLPFLLAGLFLEGRFAFLYLTGQGGVARYIHSVTIGGSLLIMGLLLWALGLIGNSLLSNRRLGEETLSLLRNTDEAMAAEWKELSRLVYLGRPEDGAGETSVSHVAGG